MKIKKLYKKFIICILIAVLFSSNSYAVKAHIDFSDKCKNKITTGLSEIMSYSDDKIPVMVWLEHSTLKTDKTSIIEEVYKNKDITTAEQLENLSAQEKLNIVHSIREKNTAEMQKICTKYNKHIATQLQKYGEVEYFDSHAPFVLMNLTPEQIEKASKDNAIQKMFHNNTRNSTPLLGISRQVIRANTVQTNGVFGETGNGINVGIIEEGIPDITNESLRNAKIHIDNNYTTISDHATEIATIIAAQPSGANATGIAPDVTLYCTSVPNGSSEHVNSLKWLLKNNVDIVNISLDWSELNQSGDPIHNIYDGLSQLLDYYSDKYMTTYVVGCGNSGTAGITSPAMSYNAISVGNLNDNNTVNTSDDSIYKSSSHNNILILNNLPSKPDLCAPGTSIVLNANAVTGTSYAAPHVTGLAALIGEMGPLLLISPPAIKATLIAGIKTGFRFVPSQRTVTTNAENPPESYIQCGAGLIDALRSGLLVKNYHVDFSVMTTETTEITFTISCAKNANPRVALVFEKSTPEYIDGIWYNNHYDNLDLFIYDSNGNLVGSSTTLNNNVEIVDFSTTSAGTYTIKIKRVATENPTNVRYAYAWA